MAWLVCLLVGLAEAAAAEHPLGLAPEAVANGGALVIAGGGAIPDAVYDEFVRLAGGDSARLVIVPTAHPFASREDAVACYNGWYSVGAKSVKFLHADEREEADSQEFVKPLSKATGVWIGGGSQGRLADRYVGTRVERELQRIVNRGGVVGGTSAGASILSRHMIRDGTNDRATIDRGLGLLPGTVIDQHFLTRRRQPRLIGALAERPDLVGVGIDERTALVVQGSRVRVVGESSVTFYRASSNGRSAWRRILEPDEQWDLSGD